MRFSIIQRLAPVIAALGLCFASNARAFDLADGLMIAVPAPKGAPALDGSDTGWDLSGAEPLWMSNQLAAQLHGSVALNYDDENLYVYAKSSLPGRKMLNRNGPSDPFWAGDCVELRLCSDPALPYPASNNNAAMHVSKQVCHIEFWKDTNDGKDYINIQYGGMHGGNQGKVFNPPGSKIAITETENQYVAQVVLPWSVLNVPNGKNPFKPGAKMTTIFGLHWLTPTQFYSVNAVYAHNPGDFAFLNWDSWGQTEFSATGNLKPRHVTMAEALASSASSATSVVGVPITVDVPEDGKLSLNIVGENGEVIRDVIGGQPVKAGQFTTYWDGRDQWGFAQTPGKYHWAAYFSHGLKVRLAGFVGSSGNPPYPTDDGKGGWGGDHGVPTAVAADDSGLYLGWQGCEAQRQIVKLDYAGNTLWRQAPFVSGSLRALASNGKYLFAAYSGVTSALTRLNPQTGLFALFGQEVGKGGAVPFGPDAKANAAIKPPEGSLPEEGGVNGMGRTPAPEDGTAPECLGLAATANEVFASVYSQNIIQVLDVESGQPTRTLSCPRPRALALDAKGNLYAVSFGTDAAAQVLRFNGVQGTPTPVVTGELVAPVGVTVDAAGRISVTDEGASQQIKTFSPDGKLVRTLGKKGGRPWAGTYDPTSYRDPSQITADKQGGLLVAESSIPKIFNRIDNASGKTLSRWFGWPGYGVANIPDPEDPMTNYYSFEPEGFARATSVDGKSGMPDAYWVPKKAGMEDVGPMFKEDFPLVKVLANGRKYFIEDINPHAVCLIDGDNFLPVGNLNVGVDRSQLKPGANANSAPTIISMWIDKNGDHKSQPEEVTTISQVDGKPMPRLATQSNSMWLDEKGNAYIITAANSILKVPAEGFARNGAILWNPAKASYVLPTVLPSLLTHGISGRQGMPGLRTDSQGNIYVCLSAVAPALTPKLASQIQTAFPNIPQSAWFAYATPELAKQNKEGLGHTAESNIAKFAKFSPDGKLLWTAGRKATAAPGPGEMYHFWTIGGMVGDNYVTGCSEWGPIYFYTTDGFYVDTLMNDPATLAPAGPYTFGSENFSGQVYGFPKLGKVFAYDQGGIYAVDGFDKNLKVEGERRFKGSVVLDKVYQEAMPISQIAASLKIVPVAGDITRDATWKTVPIVTLIRNGKPLATAKVGYDGANLYATIHVVDDTPLQNAGDDPSLVFKSGDVVGLDLGPTGERNKPVLGDLRILAAKMQGQNRLIAMKPISKQAKQPKPYTTQASGTKSFDFVGDIPGGKVVLTADADGKGYTALFTVPRSFLEFTITPGTPLKGDIEVLLSGIKSQGLQATSRNWLYSGGQVQTTMIDDIPTEAWLYPQFWGDIMVAP